MTDCDSAVDGVFDAWAGDISALAAYTDGTNTIDAFEKAGYLSGASFAADGAVVCTVGHSATHPKW